MDEEQKSNQAFRLYQKSLKKTKKNNKDFNPYEIRHLADFKEIIDYMSSSSQKTVTNVYKFVYNRKICKNNFKTSNRDYNNLTIFYINFFYKDEQMTIVYVSMVTDYPIDYVGQPTIMDPRTVKVYFNFKPIAYSENAVNKDGKPFDIDFLVKNAGLKQLKTNIKTINNRKVTPSFQTMLKGRYILSNNPNDLKGLDPRSEIFVIPNYCFGSLSFNKPNIGPLMRDFKNTVEEMKYNPDYNNISFSGEYVKEAAKQWNENFGQTSNKTPADKLEQNEDFKHTKTSGGKTKTKNKKKTKRKINKKRKTKKRY